MKTTPRSFCAVLVAGALAAFASPAAAAVSLTVDTAARTATISNAFLTARFNSAGKAHSLVYNGREIINGRAGFYLSNTATTWSPSSLRVVTNTAAMVDIAYVSSMGEHHYVVRDGVSGVYSYFITGNMGGPVGEFRTVYRVDPGLFPNSFNSRRSGVTPTLAQIRAATVLQDSTYQLTNGTVYTKYDWADYVLTDRVHGVYGSSYGLFVIPVSPEAYNGGPMKQELTVHVESNTGDSTVLNMLSASHFSAPAVTLPSGKIFGPWLVYLNNGSTSDAVARAGIEEAAWPYTWLNNAAYPTTRYTVSGTLKIADGRSTSGARVVLAQPGGDLYAMGTAYWFTAVCDSAGNFSIPKVRPGSYSLYAYAQQGDVTAQFQRDNVVVTNAAVNLGALTWSPPNYANKLWTIGIADRKAAEFRLGNQLRAYDLFKQVPANLTYTIGTSTPANNWYFCQTGVGKWTVNFNVAQQPTGNAHLTIAVAASAKSPTVNVLVNGTQVGTLSYPNDGTVYRSANQSGYYRHTQLDFAATLLRTGANSVVFDMVACAGAPSPGGIEYDIIKLEADGPSGGGGAVYQAESAVLGGGAVTETTNTGFNGSAYVNFPTTGGTLTFNNVNGGTGGTKTISFRAANGSASARTGVLTVNGVSQAITFATTGGWTTWTNTSVSVPLASSTANTIQLQTNGQDLANIDELRVP
jgi:rhamnogalacturonan endolyase